MGAQKVILGELETQFGGSAAAAGDTFAGKIKHLKDMWDGLVENLVKKALPILTNIADYMVTNVIPAVQSMAQWIGDNVVPALKDFGKWIQDNSTWLGALGVAFGVVLAAMVAYRTYLAIVSAVTKGYAAVQAVLNAVMAINPFVLILVGLAALVAALIYAWNNSETFRNIVTGVWDAIKSGVSAVLDWFTGTLWPGIQAVWDAIVGGVKWVFNMYVSIWSAIIGFVMSVPGRIMGFFSGIAGWFGNLWSNIKDGAVSGFNGLISFVSGLPGKIVSAVGNLGSLLLSAGGDLLRGLWNGISGSISWLKNKIMDWAGSLLPGWVKKILGIASPSKVFAELGKFVSQGLAVGIEDNRALRQVQRAAGNLAATVTGGFNSPQLAVGLAGGGGGSGNTYNVNVNVPPGTDLAAAGKVFKKAIAEYEKANGR
jgi:phage-related protein